jgi:hypothetical protein
MLRHAATDTLIGLKSASDRVQAAQAGRAFAQVAPSHNV